MEDEQIVALYWSRDEAAVQETEQKYNRYLKRIAYQVLADWEDCREVVNDTYLCAWNRMPPHRPTVLSTFLGKITRQLSIDVYRKKTSKKRAHSEYARSLLELEACVSGGDTTRELADARLLTQAIEGWLRGLTRQKRVLFLCRYYYLDSLRDAAVCCGMGEKAAKSMLHRLRLDLKKHLQREGFMP